MLASRQKLLSRLFVTLRSASTLVIAEHKHGKLAPNTMHAVQAAKAFDNPITLLVSGHQVDAVVDAATRVEGVQQVLVADDASLEHTMPEPSAALIAAVEKNRNFTHVVAPASTFGKNILPRAAALLDTQAIADVTEVKDSVTFVRPIYAGNALATVKFLPQGDKPCFISIRPTAFPASASGTSSQASKESVTKEEIKAAVNAAGVSEWLKEETSTSTRPELGQAKVVVSGGRALKSAENFAVLERIADLLGGAVGASRAAVDAGYAPNDLQVGQTGKVVAPDLYIAVGISGAIQHVAGMKDSKTIVSINSDGEAPIFQISDYGIVGDLFKILPELEEELKKLKA